MVCSFACLSGHIINHRATVIMLNSGKQKGRALAAALALDLLCRTIRRLPSSSAYVERDEYSRRDRDIAWHLLRGPVWQLYTRCVFLSLSVLSSFIVAGRPKLDSLVEKTANMPLLNLLGAVVKDWIPLIDEYYYCERSSFHHPFVLSQRSSSDTAL